MANAVADAMRAELKKPPLPGTDGGGGPVMP